MKHFRIKLIVLIVLILAICFALSLTFGKAEYVFTQILLFALLAVLIYSCFKIIDSTNRALSKFIFALDHQDFSIHFPQKVSHSFQDLHGVLNQKKKSIQHSIEELKSEKLSNQFILDKLPLGVLVYNQAYEMVSSNEYSKQIMAKSNFTARPEWMENLRKMKTGEKRSITTEDVGELQVSKWDYSHADDHHLFILEGTDQQSQEEELLAWMEFTKTANHEVINGLSSIYSVSSTLAESMEKKQFDPDVYRAIKQMNQKSKHLIALASDHQQILHVKAAQKSWINLEQLVSNQLDFLKQELHGIEISLGAEEMSNIYADREQIEQVLLNLILNATYALKERISPKIQIEIGQKGKHTILQFKDNGIGIRPQDQNKIFTPYFSTKEGGKGIGLSLSRLLMQNNNGRLALRESDGKQTVFELRFLMNSIA